MPVAEAQEDIATTVVGRETLPRHARTLDLLRVEHQQDDATKIAEWLRYAEHLIKDGPNMDTGALESRRNPSQRTWEW